MSTVEFTAETLTNIWARYFFATRPAFLAASFVPCLVGLATASYSGVTIDPGYAFLTVIGALLVHAGVNVLNDYYDALNGTDELNVERLYPYTGGSRFIQNGIFSPHQTLRYGVLLLLFGGLIGSVLAVTSGPGLWLIGGVGVLIGWAYSAPPLSLNSRGLGEACVALGFGVLIPSGADYVQRGEFSALPLIIGLPYGLLVANLLYINQFPDRQADEAAGKRHWVVRLGARRARWGYLALAATAYVLLTGNIIQGLLPRLAWLAAVPAVFSAAAGYRLLLFADSPAKLVPGIRLTILAAITHGLLLSFALWQGLA